MWVCTVNKNIIPDFHLYNALLPRGPWPTGPSCLAFTQSKFIQPVVSKTVCRFICVLTPLLFPPFSLLLLSEMIALRFSILFQVMAPHSSTLAWKIPGMEEPGRLQSLRSLRVGHDWATSISLSLSCIGEGNGNPLQFLPGESQGRGSLVGFRQWGLTESDTTEAT